MLQIEISSSFSINECHKFEVLYILEIVNETL